MVLVKKTMKIYIAWWFWCEGSSSFFCRHHHHFSMQMSHPLVYLMQYTMYICMPISNLLLIDSCELTLFAWPTARQAQHKSSPCHWQMFQKGGVRCRWEVLNNILVFLSIYHLTQFLIQYGKTLHEGSATDWQGAVKSIMVIMTMMPTYEASIIYLNRMEDHAVYYKE